MEGATDFRAGGSCEQPYPRGPPAVRDIRGTTLFAMSTGGSGTMPNERGDWPFRPERSSVASVWRTRTEAYRPHLARQLLKHLNREAKSVINGVSHRVCTSEPVLKDDRPLGNKCLAVTNAGKEELKVRQTLTKHFLPVSHQTAGVFFRVKVSEERPHESRAVATYLTTVRSPPNTNVTTRPKRYFALPYSSSRSHRFRSRLP